MTNQSDTAPARRLLRLPEVLSRLGMGRSALYAEIAAGRLKKPIKRGRASCWDSSAIDAYIESLIAGQTYGEPR